MAVSGLPDSVEEDTSSQYLLFGLRGSFYAVAVQAVNAIVWLPALTPIEGTPRYQVGVFNLRGRIVPVIDLAVRLGHAPSPYGVTDCVIVLAFEDRLCGVIANEVLDVLAVIPVSGQTFWGDAGDDLQPQLIRAGQVVGDGRIVMRLDPDLLIRGDDVPAAGDNVPPGIGQAMASRICPAEGPELNGVFFERARSLRQRQTEDDLRNQLGLAVVRMGKEFFGVALGAVREFVEAAEVVPVPCAPAHIVGSMNHRGNVITLIDISHMLGMAPSAAGENGKVIVAELDGLLVGIRVADILDIASIDPASLSPMPSALAGTGGEYLQGEVPYADRMLTVLDLEKILASSDLLVEQKV